jgi:hypothetical protein
VPWGGVDRVGTVQRVVPALNRVVIVLIGMVSVIGMVDAAIGRSWDQVAVFVMILLLDLVLVVRVSFRRREVTLRADLAGWLERYAAEGDERVDEVADRAVAAYRAGLTGDRRPVG